jgi:hypothetical protein
MGSLAANASTYVAKHLAGTATGAGHIAVYLGIQHDPSTLLTG